MQIAPGAYRYAVPPFCLAIPVAFSSLLASSGLVILASLILYFHRDPSRSSPQTGVLSPADGTISVIRTEDDGRLRVGVYMSAANVHVNRVPISDTVSSVTHTSGAHRPAFSKDSDKNERVHVDFDTYSVTLIAGAFARRIHPYIEAGDTLERGDRLGHISFGSRVDVLFPPSVSETDIQVTMGETVRAGESILTDESVLRA